MNSSVNKYRQFQGRGLAPVHAVTDKETTAMEMNDNELFLKQIFQTDPEKGCERLFKRYYAVLCNHAVRLVYSKEKAEDIVADVFLKFWNTKAYEAITTSYRAYLYKAVRNTALNLLKKEFGVQAGDEATLEENQIGTEDPFLVFEAEELSQDLEQTIKNLPPRCQTVFLMSRLEGNKNGQIAEKLGISVKAVEAQITKALVELRHTIQKRNL